MQGQLAVFRVGGVQLAADVGDLAGQRIRSTSPAQEPLLGSAANQASAQSQVLRVGSGIPVLSGIFPAGFASQERTMLSNVFLPPLVRAVRRPLTVHWSTPLGLLDSLQGEGAW